jgi:8-oxo-(d)GTP phosphatase
MSSCIRECTSAGGVLLRRVDSATLIVVVERTSGIEPKWEPVLRQLPKGGTEAGESLVETALREVEEETGFAAEVIGFAGTARWSYQRCGEVWRETVHYYFMRSRTVALNAHDNEFEKVRWVPIEEASRILSYPEERELLAKLIRSGLPLQA